MVIKRKPNTIFHLGDALREVIDQAQNVKDENNIEDLNKLSRLVDKALEQSPLDLPKPKTLEEVSDDNDTLVKRIHSTASGIVDTLTNHKRDFKSPIPIELIADDLASIRDSMAKIDQSRDSEPAVETLPDFDDQSQMSNSTRSTTPLTTVADSESDNANPTILSSLRQLLSQGYDYGSQVARGLYDYGNQLVSERYDSAKSAVKEPIDSLIKASDLVRFGFEGEEIADRDFVQFGFPKKSGDLSINDSTSTKIDGPLNSTSVNKATQTDRLDGTNRWQNKIRTETRDPEFNSEQELIDMGFYSAK